MTGLIGRLMLWWTLQEGLGSSSGISLLFSRTKQLTWGMTTFKSGELVVTLLAQTKAWAVASGEECMPKDTLAEIFYPAQSGW